MIKVIDIFAGPGGLSEGFSHSVYESGSHVFDIVLSVEKDLNAFDTLKLRTFLRQFQDKFPQEYYEFLDDKIDLKQLYEKYPNELAEAEKRCWNQELGKDLKAVSDTRDKIKLALGGDKDFVLIGGPPCQAYSIAGRSRNCGIEGYSEIWDKRHTLYIEYLQILADHKPLIFIMENVKGILSATYLRKEMFQRILNDLKSPNQALQRENRAYYDEGEVEYEIFSIVDGGKLDGTNARNAVVKSERYGIPQARHRVILLGVRKDFSIISPKPLYQHDRKIKLDEVVSDLPRIRGGVSDDKDSGEIWKGAIESKFTDLIVQYSQKKMDLTGFEQFMLKKLAELKTPPYDRGGKFLPEKTKPLYQEDWYSDPRLNGTYDHYSRSHMKTDLQRYFFSSCYGSFYHKSPILAEFPEALLPKHSNLSKALSNDAYFSDRFRVQLYEKPSTTIVSHISKDGHYYIHPDPTQCRSFTIREAARVQTFPDNYHFCGNRTSQFTQVGNAVPPLLAGQIAEVVKNLLEEIRVNASTKIRSQKF